MNADAGSSQHESDMDSQIAAMSGRGRLIHLIYTQQLSRTLLEDLFEVADKARQLYQLVIDVGRLRTVS